MRTPSLPRHLCSCVRKDVDLVKCLKLNGHDYSEAVRVVCLRVIHAGGKIALIAVAHRVPAIFLPPFAALSPRKDGSLVITTHLLFCSLVRLLT